MIVDTAGRPLVADPPARSAGALYAPPDYVGPVMQVKLKKPWLDHKPGDVVTCAPNQGRWLVETGRADEVTEGQPDAADKAKA